jgi:hypothetical protein
MTDQVKVRTLGSRRSSASSDPHARYHDRDWLTVVKDNGEGVVAGVLECRCSCGNAVYVHDEEVIRRRTLPVKS